jgi:hypothetical protein
MKNVKTKSERPRIMARFSSRTRAEQAMNALQDAGLGVRVDLVSHPVSSPLFDRRRLVWAGRGALVGAIAGGIAAGIYAGGFVESSFAAVFGAVVGAALVGTLGLLFGLGVGEVRAPTEVALSQRERDRVDGDVFVRVELAREAGDDEEGLRVREVLRSSGATSVANESRSAPPDEAVLETRPV